MAVHKERRREAFLKESFAEQWQRQQAERARPAWQQRQQPHVAVQQVRRGLTPCTPDIMDGPCELSPVELEHLPLYMVSGVGNLR